jgi:hypothetical protein
MQIKDDKREIGSISGFTHQQIEEMHMQMMDETHPLPVDSDDEILIQNLNSEEDVEREIIRLPKDRSTILCIITKSRNLNLALKQTYNYIEDVENDTVVGNCLTTVTDEFFEYNDRILVPKDVNVVKRRNADRRALQNG